MSAESASNPQPRSTQPVGRSLRSIRTFGRMIKFSHSIFALPFALAAAAIAAEQHGLTGFQVLVIVLAMVSARTAAMGFNRIVDRRYDAQNPRTADREIPSGQVSIRAATALVALSTSVFIACSAWLGPACLALSPIALLLLFGYSYTKRFTWLCHLFLGLAIAGGPAGAWLAVAGSLSAPAYWLMLAVATWIGGFDILYALGDLDFDRKAGLRSIPNRFGVRGALWISRVFHMLTAVALLLVGTSAERGFSYYCGAALVAGLLVWEHRLLRPDDLSRLNTAFFTLNGYVSIVYFVATLVDVVSI